MTPGNDANKPVLQAEEELDRIEQEVTIQLWTHQAWGLMLIRKGIIPRAHAAGLAALLLDLERADVGTDSDKTHRGVEAYAIETLGAAAAGNLSIARTQPTPYMRMRARLPFLRFMGHCIVLLQNLLEVAERFRSCVMPGYTHLAHAQPMTFGHYLVSVHDPLRRVFDQMELAYTHLNLNELGCGALAGTSWPIDRAVVSDWLGFDGYVENTNDAVSGTDGFVSAAASVANAMSILSRFSLDLNYWATAEFDFLDVPRVRAKPSHSYMMPQKTAKNNGDLEDLRIAAANAAGYLAATVANASRVPHADMHEMIRIERPLMSALEECGEQIWRLGINIRGIKTHEARMLEMARTGFSCATELANHLVRTCAMDYRTAHHIVNRFVNEALAKGKNARDVDAALLDQAAVHCGHVVPRLSDEALRRCLDPVHFVHTHASPGGVSPREVARMVACRREDMAEVRCRHVARVGRLRAARKSLWAGLQGILNEDRTDGTRSTRPAQAKDVDACRPPPDADGRS